MSGVALTGAGGFLGWHTRCSLRARGINSVPVSVGARFDANAAVGALSKADHVVHLAGVNRADDAEITDGNLSFALQLAESLRKSKAPPSTITYANSIQSGNGSVYGEAKARAGEVLATVAAEIGASFRDVRLPNIFGEHGRPFYNSVVATFCHQLAEGHAPTVDQDRDLTLLHAQNAAELLTSRDSLGSSETMGFGESVSGIAARLTAMSACYSNGEIPSLELPDDRDLFNTLRSFTVPHRSRIELQRQADQRGSFFEVLRSHGGSGQTSFSTTVPDVTRGEHFHLRKVERFAVLSGSAVISMRRLFTSEVFKFTVTGEEPSAIDMPTMWAHSIRNTGQTELYTAFWTNEIFDPSRPDTVAEDVSL